MRSLLIVVASTLLPAATLLAQTGPELLIRPIESDLDFWESSGDAMFQKGGETSNGEDFQLSVFDYQGRIREQNSAWIPRIGWDLTYMDMSTDEPLLDEDLTDVSVGAGFELPTYGGWQSGFAIGIGYAGSSPFAEGDAWYGLATFRIGRKIDEKSDLAFIIDYNGNRSIWPDIPLPGFAYRRQPNDKLTYVIGIPVTTIIYRPDKPISLELSWVMVDAFNARAQYELSPEWKVYGELAARSEAFSIDGLDDDDRLLFQQKRAELGVQWNPWKHTKLIAAAGYAFSGEFSAGFDQGDSDLVADLPDEPYVRLSFERRF